MSLLILDRDGVINQDSDDYIRSLDDWVPITGSIEAIAERAASSELAWIKSAIASACTKSNLSFKNNYQNQINR